MRSLEAQNPLIKFGTVVATVALIFVPNCSALVVTITTQYPEKKPISRQLKYNHEILIPAKKGYKMTDKTC